MLGDRTFLTDGVTVIADNDWPTLVPGLPPGNGITRPRLHKILQDAVLESGADVRTGVTVDDAGGHRRPRRRRLHATRDSRSYDLVVGADGLYSQTRELVFGPEHKAEYTGQVCWRYNLPRIEGLDKIWAVIGPSGAAGFVPLAPDLMYMLTIEKPPEGAPIRLPQEGIAEIYRERLAPYRRAGRGAPRIGRRRRRGRSTGPSRTSYCRAVAPRPRRPDRRRRTRNDAALRPGRGTGDRGRNRPDRGARSGRRAVEAALEAFMARRYDRCRMIVEGSEAIGAWEQDHSLPIDPVKTRFEVTMAAMAPI